MDPAHQRPPGADDATVEAVGKLTEAFEWIERARGQLYTFHQLMGHADQLVREAADALDAAGHSSSADDVRERLVGRNTIDGRWTFQIVEEFDDGYYTDARSVERRVRDELMAGRRHVFEAELKEKRRTAGRKGHEARPLASHEAHVPTMADFEPQP